MKDVRAILTVSGGYIAAIIGAGFASGQEIVSFFVTHGRSGIIGIFIACIAFSLFSYAVLSVCIDNAMDSYSDFLALVFRWPVFRKIAGATVFICSAASLCVMTACAGEIGSISTGAGAMAGAAVFTVLCAAIFLSGGRRIMGISASLGAVIVAGIIFTAFYILRFREHQTFAPWLSASVSGFTYAGYNLVGTGALLALSSRFLKTKGDAAISSAVSGAVLFIMITLIWGVLSIYYGKINLGEIPMLTMALRQNKALGIFYGIMLAAAVLTTGISNGFALIDILSKKMNKIHAALAVALFGFCAGGVGFSYLINTVYRFCGYIGAAVAFAIVFKSIFKLKNREK